MQDDHLTAYAERESSFVAGLLPPDALKLRLSTVLELLEARHGSAITAALSQEASDPRVPGSELSKAVRSPRSGQLNSDWMRTTNMVGINVRTVGDFGGVVKYLLTVPTAFDSVHLLPIWEPGVVDSLYGLSSWNLNPEFFSEELAALHGHLDTVPRQLRATVNLLHVMGRTVGMDVIPHTDRFSEMALANPNHFEWMQVIDGQIVDHSAQLHEQAQAITFGWLTEVGPAVAPEDGLVPRSSDELMALGEPERIELLFGSSDDPIGRNHRRVELIKRLKWFGYEPVPATMGVPYRDIRIADSPAVVDEHGMIWHDYVMSEPRFMSRVFTPLARYKLYGRVDDNAHWEVDFDAPRRRTWDYVTGHYAQAAAAGNFDFMRGDMSHVQMRPDGVPDRIDDFYDILRAVKTRIQQETPHFGYFAESFLPARDVFQYGEELDHLEASLADATLGDLQSASVGGHEYLRRFRRYLDDLATRKCAPAYGVMTADKDDPRFDEYYRAGNEVRYLTALLLTDMPSYTALGFELRDVRHEPAENERYTKLFVFWERGSHTVYPSKARVGESYVWGENTELFERLGRIRQFAEEILPDIERAPTRWLVPPDATTLRGTAVWTQLKNPRYVIATNADTEFESGFFGVPGLAPSVVLTPVFSTTGDMEQSAVRHNGYFHRIENLKPGEGIVYSVT